GRGKARASRGDVAQTGDIGGAASWSQALAPFVGDRWRLATLSVNYRTPTEIMTVAADVLAQIDPDATPPRSVRETGAVPWRLRVPDAAGLGRRVGDAAAAPRDRTRGGAPAAT